MPKARKMSRRKFLALSGAGVASLALGGTGYAGVSRFVVNEHNIVSVKLNHNLKVAHLSDLHFSSLISLDLIEEWVKTTMQHQPDLIAITGDFITSGRIAGNLPEYIQVLSSLKAPKGVYAVWGNHDYSLKDLPAFEKMLGSIGIQVLTNQNINIRDDFSLAGLDDYWNGTPQISEALAGIPKEHFTLLLNHNPDILPDIPTTVDLTICGHTHGGQVRVPYYGALHVPSKYGERFAQGFVEAPAKAFVSRGLGVTAIPLRINCPPEIVIFNFLVGPL